VTISTAAIVKLAEFWGGPTFRLSAQPVCRGHSAPAEFLRQQIVDRPPIVLWHGPRGSGKSYLSGMGTWIDSYLYDDHGTRILGGSLAQSEQIYTALRAFDRQHPDRSPLTSFTKTAARFCTGSEVSILAASPKAVRGPHVARLRLDEVDEIDADIRESAMGMCMGLRGIPASVVMTSTWHRVGGPMTELMERGRNGDFPVHTFCIFEVLERCPDERSGRSLDKCPDCPLVSWCHADRDSHPLGLPKAKRSNGHYPIESLIQKLRAVSGRVFASDYLCEGPKAAGVWFTAFDAANVTETAEYDISLPVHVSIDSGVFTGAVFFQFREYRGVHHITVFDDYLAEGLSAEVSAAAILDQLRSRCGEARRRVSTDSSGGARNPVGPTVLAEYERAGLRGERGIETWPKYAGCVADGLALIEALVRSGDGSVGLTVHPRCRRLTDAFGAYARAKRAGQWQDYPEDPQHPHEDLIDALRGGLKIVLPESRRPQPVFNRQKAGRIF
jgi:hypothetical protein